MTGLVRNPTQSSESLSPKADARRQSRLSLGGSDIDVRTSDQRVGSAMSGDGGAAPANRKNWFARTRDRLRGRTVPRWTGKGAAAGLTATGLGGGIATGVAVAAGKGAAIGAAFGSVIPGVGTVGGALIGSLVGAALAAGIGGLIGFAAAGGRSRDKAEQAIDSLRGEGLITPQQAGELKDLSNDDLKTLCEIPRWAHLDADQEAFRKLLLLTAAKDGQEAVQALRDEVLKYASSGKAGRVARNLLEVRACLERAPSWQQLDDEKQEELLRYMHDEATGLARQGISLGQHQAETLLGRARERVGQLNSLYLGEISRCRNQAVETMGQLLDELGRDQLSSERAVHGLLEVNDLLSEMQGYEQENSQEQRIRTHVDNVAGDAIVRHGANANHLLGAALAPGSALRTAVQGAQAYSEQAATEAERYLAVRVVEGAQRLVRLLGEIGGPAAESLEADQSTLMGAAADRDQARDRFARWIVPELVSRLTVGSILNSQNAVLKSQFARWAAQTGRDTRFETVHEINRALAVTGPEFDTRFGTVSNKLPDIRGIPPKTRRALQYAAAHGDEAEKKELLRQVRDGLVPIRRFRDWYANQGRGDGADT